MNLSNHTEERTVVGGTLENSVERKYPVTCELILRVNVFFFVAMSLENCKRRKNVTYRVKM